MPKIKFLEAVPFAALVLSTLALVAALGLSGCGPVPEAAADEAAAEVVVEDFYTWYLNYIGDRASGEFRNPLVDGAYRESEQLDPAFVESVDELLGSFEFGAYDPFLCAQDIPEEIFVGEAEVDGDSALVPVETSFAGHAFEVSLSQLDGQWKIADIVCR
jgi:hypothetical protein